MKITFDSIGTIHTPFKTKKGMPIQSQGAIGIKGQIILNENYSHFRRCDNHNRSQKERWFGLTGHTFNCMTCKQIKITDNDYGK